MSQIVRRKDRLGAVLVLVAALGLGPAIVARAAEPAAAAQSESSLLGALKDGTPAEQSGAADYIIAHPDAVNPLFLGIVAKVLFERGDRLQGAFWFYIFQSRTQAWARSDPQGYGAARGALNDEIGTTINGWVGSDLHGWWDLASRAIAYEARIPLYPGRPDGVSAADWDVLVKARRAAYETDFHKVMDPVRDNSAAAEKVRASNGLYVGPWQDPGAPLPDDWR